MNNCKSFKPSINNNSKILILGSMPGVKSLEEQQYYAHPQNRFWKVMSAICNEPKLHEFGYDLKLKTLLKNNIALRNALYDAYNRLCPYCGQTIQNLRDMEVDHILATSFINRPELQGYLTYLTSCGFCIERPDYIENYFPAHSYCNLDKSNRVNEFSLPYWHDIAIQHTPKVLRLMEKYKNQGTH